MNQQNEIFQRRNRRELQDARQNAGFESDSFKSDFSESTDCHRFKQSLDNCLDDRGSISAFASDVHLRSCRHCQTSFAVYRHFSSVGGAVLNGGALPVRHTSANGSPSSVSRPAWALPSAMLLASTAVLVGIALLLSPGTEPIDINAALKPTSPVTTEITHPTGLETNERRSDPEDLPPPWNSNYVNQLRAAIDYSRQPGLNQFCHAGEVSRNLLSQNILQPIDGCFGDRWMNPWLYASELPGIRPIHRSVNVALVLYH